MDITQEQSILEALNLLTDRDQKDALIDQTNRTELVENGLAILAPSKIIEIDTGVVVGVDNVVDQIVKNVEPTDKIIAIEGLSGVGKSSTTQGLKSKLNGSILSLSDIFRVLTWQYFVQKKMNHEANIEKLNYCIENRELCLKCDGEDIENLRKHLHDQQFSVLIPDVAKETQEMVIRFVANELLSLAREYNGHILLEGRAFSLDFIPCNLRIKLVAEPIIRAKRRLEQFN